MYYDINMHTDIDPDTVTRYVYI